MRNRFLGLFKPSYILARHITSGPHPRSMATATAIHLTPKDAGIAHAPSIRQGSATAANQVLQDNHDNLHIYMDLKNGLHSDYLPLHCLNF